MTDIQTPPPDAVVVAQGGVTAMRSLCDELRENGLNAALVPPPGGCGTG